MSFVIRRAQIHARPEQLKRDQAHRIAGRLQVHHPDMARQTALDLGYRALDFCRSVALRGSDTVLGVAFLMAVYGPDVFRAEPNARPIADATRSEAERKTLIHAELKRLEKAGS